MLKTVWINLLMVALLSSCASSGRVSDQPRVVYIDNVCDVLRPIYVSEGDSFTESTARAILTHNILWNAKCYDVKPATD